MWIKIKYNNESLTWRFIHIPFQFDDFSLISAWKSRKIYSHNWNLNDLKKKKQKRKQNNFFFLAIKLLCNVYIHQISSYSATRLQHWWSTAKYCSGTAAVACKAVAALWKPTATQTGSDFPRIMAVMKPELKLSPAPDTFTTLSIRCVGYKRICVLNEFSDAINP